MSEADVRLDKVRKSFGAVVAVNDVTLDIERGTIFSLLGPSGCGKTTTLRLIAGFEQPSAGEVYIRGQRVTSIAPYRRDFSMVFQSYALFPHLNVAENVAFGLRMRRVPRSERGAAVKEALELVKLGALADRYPRQLSGGQQQRVALARAIVVKPAVLLLDEPLGALDKMLREEMQVELRDLQQRLDITAVFVTHDQEEALTLSDRVAVMRGGVIEQVGAPREIYDRPVSEFVAGFLGASNFLDGSVVARERRDRRGGNAGWTRARDSGIGAGRHQGACGRSPRACAHGCSRRRRAARQVAQHRLSGLGDALLHEQRRRALARLCAERRRRRLGGRRRRVLRMGRRRRGAGRPGTRVKGVKNLWGWALLTPPLAVALVLFVIPLLYLFYISLHAASPSEIYGSTLTLENYTSILGDSFYLGIIRRTLGTASAILGLCLFIGYPVAYFVALLPTRRRMIVMLLLLFPLMVSNVVRAYGWVALLGRRGVINTGLRDMGVIDVPLDLLYNTEAVVVGLMTILLPYMVITIANTLSALDRRYEEAAQALGAGPVRTFLHVTLPLSTPGVASGMLLVFLLTLSAYVTITLLGGPRSKLLVSMVYDSVVGFQWPRAAALAFILLALALALTGVILAVLRPNRIQGTGR